MKRCECGRPINRTPDERETTRHRVVLGNPDEVTVGRWLHLESRDDDDASAAHETYVVRIRGWLHLEVDLDDRERVLDARVFDERQRR